MFGEYSLYYCRLPTIYNALRFCPTRLMIQYCPFTFDALLENVSQNIFHA